MPLTRRWCKVNRYVLAWINGCVRRYAAVRRISYADIKRLLLCRVAGRTRRTSLTLRPNWSGWPGRSLLTCCESIDLHYQRLHLRLQLALLVT